ncbi:transposase-like protein [Desulfobaculum xiamenense]|uniref:Transposase-like protein n=1 Tax=Desulfobaculum xiamenense TaxID=995050 RepID=A0A846QR93_9BACT|nr:transposase-like protein [Desulfobaculum xiamenense]
MSRNRRTYDAEFKWNAVQMVEESGRAASEVAQSLGIGVDLIYHWRREMLGQGHIGFPAQGKEALTDEQHRIRELDRDILKKHWPSSARHRNEILFHQGPPLAVFDEEDVPRAQGFPKRILWHG